MRKDRGVIDLRGVKPETMAKFDRVNELIARDSDLPIYHHCKRAGLSYEHFKAIRKAKAALLGTAGGLGLAPDEALG